MGKLTIKDILDFKNKVGMGKKIAPIYSEAGFDLDYEWQLPQLEHWIKNKL